MSDPEARPRGDDRRIPGLVLAAGLFSVVPVPPAVIGRDDARRAIGWFPVLGALVGLVSGTAGALVRLVADAPLLAAAIVLVVAQALVGAMHLDGLADAFDGLAALGSRKQGRDTTNALDIMRKPDIGAMGVAAIVLVLSTQLAALAAMPDAGDLVATAVVAAATGRLAISFATRPSVPSARPGGFGALFQGVTPVSACVVSLVVVLGLSAGLGWWSAGVPGAVGLPMAVLVAIGVAVGWTRRLVTRLGGLTGDMMGALVEVTTAVVLVGGALALRAG
ncbi:adenosylcobinamide-GDP ribazoletransferase [Brooklawnia cerclae]|uniref:Adenosylcobinamide-GDP ribazoletransferase n=1 Tax=Brooklawnia cerclae TaxID=349934 RepID=A0ABX0SI20_9ACTN|nr:adenosylcobinamide-GDP ribazoletransferase [Brooklawnia cerclae]